jgi:peptide/nickel transport system substrate-binding protein
MIGTRPSRTRLTLACAAALTTAVALAACSSSSSSPGHSSTSFGLLGQFGHVPTEAAGTEHAGTITIAAPPNSAPTWILPIVPGANNSVFVAYEFQYQMWRPLIWYVNGVSPTQTPALSLANNPVWTNGDKTVTITLKPTYKWSDGQPITAQDVLFYYEMVKAAVKESPAYWAAYTPGLGVPDQVASVSTPNPTTFVMNMKTAVNPTWFAENELGSFQPLPSHSWDIDAAGGAPITDWATNPADATKIYNYLSAQSKDLATYATNSLWKVVDGPYNLTAFDASTGAFTMTPNPSYDGPHAKVVSSWQSVPFTSDTAEYNAVKAGQIDIGYVPLTNVPQVGTLSSSYNSFGYPEYGFLYVAYNFKDTTGDFNNIIDQLYIRQALAHLENQQGYIHAFAYGAASQAYGTVPELPSNPFTPADAMTNPYPYSQPAAETLLKNNGWSVVPDGTDSCIKPGTGAGECGAGIPAGTKLEWNLIYNTNPAIIGEMDQDWASNARAVGITINLASSNFDYMIANYNDPAAPKTIDKWAMEDFGGFSNPTYPTTFGLFNATGSTNIGGYSSAEATQLITASITSPNPTAVKAEASYLTQQQPGLFEPDIDNVFGTQAILVWQKDLSGPATAFETLTQIQYNPEQMFFTK